MATKQVRVTRKRTRSTTDRDDHHNETPATDRREIRRDIARVWWPDA